MVAGSPATFSVQATSTNPITYQWQENGTDIPGASLTTYTISATTAADNGLKFDAVVTDSAGSVTSTAARLTVTPAPLTAIKVTAPNSSIPLSAIEQVVATGIYGDGATQDLTNSVTWNSSAPTVAMISGTGQTFAVGLGQTTIQASSGPIVGSTTLTVTSGFVPDGEMKAARDPHTAILLNDGSVLIAGGIGATGPLASAETYNAATNSFTLTANMNTSREAHTATLLQNGMVLIAGGNGGAASPVALASAEIYNPSTGTFAATTGSMSAACYGHTATLLNDGTALIAGGNSGSAVLETAETYDLGARTFSLVGSIRTARYEQTATLLVNGTVLIAGGNDGTGPIAFAELYQSSTITPQGLVSVSISPPDVPLGLGASQRLIAMGTFTDGSTEILSSLSWSSSDPAVVTVSNDSGSDSVAFGNSTGTATVTATDGAVSASRMLTVGAATLVSIAVTPAGPTIAKGTSEQFTATGTYTDGSTQNLTGSVMWTSGTPTVATINAAGLATGVSTGTSSITASLNGVTSPGDVLTVGLMPSIVVQPADETVLPGQSATFTVVASGTAPLSYQWLENTTSIAGANSSTYVTSATKTADDGSVFYVVVTNGVGWIASTAATLTVGTPPSITSGPSNQSVGVGDTATFTVNATGTAPLTYQWQENNADIPGATNSTYTTPATTTTDNGEILAVVVANAFGVATSNTATLSVNVSPTISIQPEDQAVNAGQTATFTVMAVGAEPLSYQWQENGTSIQGATSPSYTTLAATAADNNAAFDVVVTNASGSTTSASATLTVVVPPTISVEPASQSVSVGQTATFSVAVLGSAPVSYQWQENGTNIAGAQASTYATPPTTSADNGSQITVIATNAAGEVTSSAATLTVNPASPVDVVTYHNDDARTGKNINETILTTSNVNAATFGKIRFFPVDGSADAQPLYLSNVPIPNKGIHDVLYVATENDSVYAFDAVTGLVLWQTSVLNPGEGASDNRGCSEIIPTMGITATPVIDRTQGPNGAIYIVAMSTDGAGHYYQRLHALDITSGAELFGGPTNIQGSYPGTGDNTNGQDVIFDPSQYKERAGLLVLNGTVYTTWGSNCDQTPYTGWIMGFQESTLTMTSILNFTPNGSGGAIGMSGAGPAADAAGNIYLLDGSGTFDATLNASGFPTQGDFGGAFLKISNSPGLSVSDYFEPFNQASENLNQISLGSGGALILPDLNDTAGHTWHLAVGQARIPIFI